MLIELEIKDFALVEHVRVPFSWGLNVLTGETGAGKSILMDALNAVLGGKVNASVIRAQADRASIEATFKSSPELTCWLKEHELSEVEEDTFVLSREISRQGSKLRINGSLVNLSLMQDLRQRLVTVHAQHESRTLMSSQSQLELLDALGDQEHKKLLQALKTSYARRRQLDLELNEILKSEAERERRLDFARYQLAELEAAQLEDPNEDDLVNRQRKLLSRVSEIESLLSNAQVYLKGHDLDGQPGALELLQKAQSELAKAAAADERLAEQESALNELLSRVEDESRAIRKYLESLESDPETLSLLDERSAVLATIKRKYGPELAQAIQKQAELEEEIEKYKNAETLVLNLEAELKEVNSELLAQVEALSAKRQALAESLSRRIQKELVELGMSNCRFEISLLQPEHEDPKLKLESIGPSGHDKCDFLICPNPGQPLLPLAKIASGGELSRIMLAVKTIFAGAEKASTVVFDEIDTGLSGKVLQTMRDKLARLASSQQILCITHQPIIASVADSHIYVTKEQNKTSTKTDVSILDEESRLKALASMASGHENQEAALGFARALFDESSKVKAKFNS